MKRRIVIIAAVIAAIVVCALLAGRDSTPMPVYQGKTARQWLRGVDDSDQVQSRLAFKAMGSNTVPFLVQELERKDSSWVRIYSRLYVKMPSSVRKHFSPPYNELERWSDASTALSAAQSRTAIVPLTQLLTNSESWQQMSDLLALDKLVGPGDTNCVAPLISCSRSKEFYVSIEAAQVLSRISPGKVEIPPLTNFLLSTNRWAQIKSLGILNRVDTTNSAIWKNLLTNKSAWMEWQLKAHEGHWPTNSLAGEWEH